MVANKKYGWEVSREHFYRKKRPSSLLPFKSYLRGRLQDIYRFPPRISYGFRRWDLPRSGQGRPLFGIEGAFLV